MAMVEHVEFGICDLFSAFEVIQGHTLFVFAKDSVIVRRIYVSVKKCQSTQGHCVEMFYSKMLRLTSAAALLTPVTA